MEVELGTGATLITTDTGTQLSVYFALLVDRFYVLENTGNPVGLRRGCGAFERLR